MKNNKLENRYENGNTFLHQAVNLRQLDIVCYMITKGVDANIRNDDGNTPLHLAMLSSNKDVNLHVILDNSIFTKSQGEFRNS